MPDNKKNLGQLLSSSLPLTVASLGRLFVIFLLTAVTLLVIFAVFWILALVLMRADNPQSSSALREAMRNPQIIVLGIFCILGWVMLAFLSGIAAIKIIQSVDEQIPIGPITAIQEAAGIFSAYLWASILVFIRLLFWFFPFLITIGYAVMQALRSLNRNSLDPSPFMGIIENLPIGVKVAFGIATVTMTIAGIVFMTLYAYSALSVVLDQKRGIEALAYSKKMIKPNFWRFTGYWALLVILFLIITAIGEFMGKLILLQMPSTLISALLKLFSHLFSFLTSSYFVSFSYLLYREFQKEKSSVVEEAK
ncbi:MAG: hypothetical protein WC676_02070 [Candidatus Omnitrophota bacterium]